MEQYSDNKAAIREYLLGGLDPEGQSRLEKRLLTDGEYFDELVVEEDELVEDYLDGALSEAERERFEKHFLLAPERVWKLETARLLKNYSEKEAAAVSPEPVGPTGRPAPPFWEPLLAFFKSGWPAQVALATVLLLTLGGIFIALRQRPEQNLPEQVRDVPPRVETPAPPGGASALVLVVALTPGLERSSAAAKRITVEPGVETVQLRLELTADEYRRYGAALRDDKQEILANTELKAESAGVEKFVALNVPARLLAPGDYRVSLSGEAPDGRTESVNSYVFKVAGR